MTPALAQQSRPNTPLAAGQEEEPPGLAGLLPDDQESPASLAQTSPGAHSGPNSINSSVSKEDTKSDSGAARSDDAESLGGARELKNTTDDRPTEHAATERSRALYLDGSKHARSEQWQLALNAYQAAFDLFPAPSTLYNIGYCQAKLGDLVAAWQSMSRALRLSQQGQGPTLSEQRRARAVATHAELQSRLPQLIIRGATPQAVSFEGALIVRIPGEPAAYRLVNSNQGEPSWLPPNSKVYVNPGRYHVTTSDGSHRTEHHLQLSEGAAVTLEAATPPNTLLASEASPPPNQTDEAQPLTLVTPAPDATESTRVRPYRTVGLVSLLAAGVSVTAALVSLAIALDAEGTLKEECAADGSCPNSQDENVSRYETASVITNVGLVAGVSLGVTGLSFLLVDARSGRTTVSVGASPLGMRINGQF